MITIMFACKKHSAKMKQCSFLNISICYDEAFAVRYEKIKKH